MSKHLSQIEYLESIVRILGDILVNMPDKSKTTVHVPTIWIKQEMAKAQGDCPFCDSTVPHYHYHTHDEYVPEPHPEKTGMTGNTKCNHVRFDRVHATYCPDCGMHRTTIEGGG